jgi:hypothetical protein
MELYMHIAGLKSRARDVYAQGLPLRAVKVVILALLTVDEHIYDLLVIRGSEEYI